MKLDADPGFLRRGHQQAGDTKGLSPGGRSLYLFIYKLVERKKTPLTRQLLGSHL